MKAPRCPTCGQPLGLEARVRAWAADVRALAQHLDAEAAARETPYRTARYRRWGRPVAVLGGGLLVGAAFVPAPWWGPLMLAAAGWGLAAMQWVTHGDGGAR